MIPISALFSPGRVMLAGVAIAVIGTLQFFFIVFGGGLLGLDTNNAIGPGLLMWAMWALGILVLIAGMVWALIEWILRMWSERG